MDLLFQEDAYLKECTATVLSVDEKGVRLDRTIFYPNGGGQPGDSGIMVLPNGDKLAIVDTLKGDGHLDVVHVMAEDSALSAEGDQVTVTLDWERRHKHMRFHTCMHVLCSLIEGDVTGGNLSDQKARLDFNLPDGVPDKEELNAKLAAIVAADKPTKTIWINDEEMAAQPELVRTMSVKPPSGAGRVRLLEIQDVDLQPCGGTHLKSTGEIGNIIIGKVENKGKMNRRFNLKFGD